MPTVREFQVADIVTNGAKAGINIHDTEIRFLNLLVSIAKCGEDHPTYSMEATAAALGGRSPLSIFRDRDRTRYNFFRDRGNRISPGEEMDSGVLALLYLEVYKVVLGHAARDGLKFISGDSMMRNHASKYQRHIEPGKGFTGDLIHLHRTPLRPEGYRHG